MCAGHESGCEVAIYVMNQIFNKEDSDAVLLIDAFNAFNVISSQLLREICPEIAVFIRNCCFLALIFFMIARTELKSFEGMTQGDLAAMAIYTIAIISLLLMLVDQEEQLVGKATHSATYIDNFTGAGSITNLLHWWNTFNTLGPLFGYHPALHERHSFEDICKYRYKYNRRC